MKLLVEFSHPAQVHKFWHALGALQERGVEILILSRDKDVMLEILDDLPFQHVCLSKARGGVLAAMAELCLRECRALWHALRFRPNLILSAHSVAVTHVGWLLRIPRLVHEDSEFGTLQQRLYMPFASRIITSTAYYLDWGPRQLRIPSLEPLAYLHPNRFRPDRERIRLAGLPDGCRYAVVRLIAWEAMHDRGLEGAGSQQVEALVKVLLAAGFDRVVLSAEQALEGELRDAVLPLPARDFHHVLAFAGLCLSESITVAGEAAVLGVPTLLVNPLKAGHSLELERYHLIERCPDVTAAAERALELGSDPATPARWAAAREQLLADKTDMSAAFVDVIEQELGKACSTSPAPGE